MKDRESDKEFNVIVCVVCIAGMAIIATAAGVIAILEELFK